MPANGREKIAYDNDAQYITKQTITKLNSYYPLGMRESKVSEKQVSSCCKMGLGVEEFGSRWRQQICEARYKTRPKQGD